KLFPMVFRRAIEQLGNRLGNQLDMANFLKPDPLDEVMVRLAITAEIETLEEELHHRAHFTELPAQAFLEGIGGRWIRLVDDNRIDQILGMVYCRASRF